MQFNDTFTNIIRHDLKEGLIPMLLGEPGIGKSSWVEDLATSMHTKAFTLACNQLADKSDLTGARLVPIEENGKKDYVQVFYPHVEITRAVNYANSHPNETPILFLDELNRTTPDVTSEALSIPTMRRIGNKTLPENLKVIAAGNDKGNVTSLDEASISRFVFYSVSPDVETFLKVNDDLHPAIIKVLRKNPDYIFAKQSEDAVATNNSDDDDNDNGYAQTLDSIFDDASLKQLTTPRTITGLSKWLNSYTRDELYALMNETVSDDQGNPESLLETAIEAHTGKTVFTSAVYSELSNMLLSSQNTAQPADKIKKPNGYDNLKSQTNISDLDKAIETMTDSNKQNTLIYALYEQDDNTNLIDELVDSIDRFDSDHLTRLAKLAVSNKLNDSNVTYMQSIEHNHLVDQLSVILMMN